MPAIYGDTWIDDARTALVARITALRDSMISYSPTFSYVYDRHNVANLLLNAVSVGLESGESDYSARSTKDVVTYLLNFTVRVHTAFSGGIADDKVNAELIASVVNKLNAKRTLTLGSLYIKDVSSIRASVDFPESATRGAGCVVTVMKSAVDYTQE